MPIINHRGITPRSLTDQICITAVNYLVSIGKHRMRNYWFPIRKGGFLRSDQEIKGLRGGILLYAAQAIPQIDTARAEKNPFRKETT